VKWIPCGWKDGGEGSRGSKRGVERKINHSELKVPTCMARRACESIVVIRFGVHIFLNGNVLLYAGLSCEVERRAEVGVCCNSTS
jgi:hypothetical protein